jgi:hypothetical protein
MKTVQMALVGLVLLGSAAHGETYRHKVAAPADHGQYSAAWPSAPSGIARSGNECGTDAASPVWGPGSTLLGYTCVSITN